MEWIGCKIFGHYYRFTIDKNNRVCKRCGKIQTKINKTWNDTTINRSI